MTDADRILSDFTRAWESGASPDPDDYIDRAPAAERAALSEAIRAYLAVAPEPDYDDAALTRLAADPAAVRAAEFPLGEAEPWPVLLPRLRERAGLSWAEVAQRLGVRRPERAERYLAAMEAGDHEPRRVTRRALDALARILAVPVEALSWSGPPPKPVLLRAAAPVAAAASAPPPMEELELLADLGTRDADDFDDSDLLFLGGRDLA